MQDDKDETIRRRAYAIWEAEGRPEGRDREHWTRAEADEGGPEGGYATGEEASSEGAPEPGSGLPEAQAQPGEGVPREEGQPLAAAPDAESEALLAEGGGTNRRGGHTGP